MTYFTLGSSVLGGSDVLGYPNENTAFNQSKLLTVIQQYLYQQYADDSDLQAFVDSFNEIAQSYLDWFNNTPLGLYTSTNISGPLLDWIANGVYGYSRPIFAVPQVIGNVQGGLGYSVLGESVLAAKTFDVLSQGSVTYVNDDIYKRALTWHTYIGDGRQASTEWLRRRLARFLYGANGSDFQLSNLSSVSITHPSTVDYVGYLGSGVSLGTIPLGYLTSTTHVNSQMLITLPSSSPVALTLQMLLTSGYLAIPFQLKFKVVIT